MEIELPDGTIAEFPDGMAPQEIEAVLAKQFGGKTSQEDSSSYLDVANSFLSGAVDGVPLIGPSALSGARNVAGYISDALDPIVPDAWKADRQGTETGPDLVNRQAERAIERFPIANMVGKISGAGATGIGAGAAGLTAMRFVKPSMTGAKALGANAAALGLDGAAFGALDAIGRGDDVKQSMMIGAGAGALGAPVAAGASKAANFMGGAMGFGQKSRAAKAITEALGRSGKTRQEVVTDLSEAAADGQEFMLADSLGKSGQRMLSGVARTPGSARQKIAETLTARQEGQASRISAALADGLNAPNTANAQRSVMKAARSDAAKANYDAAVDGASAVNLSPAIESIDDALGRNPILGETALKQSEVGRRLQSVRDQISNGGEQLIDFQKVLNVKQDLGDSIQNLRKRGQSVPPQVAGTLGALDDALENASTGYRKANDTFRAQSQAIDAIDSGVAATSGRVRAEDTISRFSNMAPDQQQAFRVGYSDPLIARVDAAASSPTTNKARPLLTGKFGKELPVIADPNLGPQMIRRLNREQTMFETASEALGGSKTADNLADQLDVANFDGSMLANLATGNFRGAVTQALTKGGNALSGRDKATREIIAEALMSSAPTKANATLLKSIEVGEKLNQRQINAVRGLIGVSVGAQPALSN